MTKADIILSSQAVFTGLGDHPYPASIAVKGNKIVAVGDSTEIQPFIGAHTKSFDFGDQLITAGFHDAHLHLLSGSLHNNFSVHLHAARSQEEAVMMVKDFAEKNPIDEWIIGSGWDSNNWENNDFPHRSALDQVVKDRPVFLFHAEFHYAWVNSKALEVANITSQTENPPYGIIEKDRMGQPTGILIEKAISLVSEKAMALSEEKLEELLTAFLQHAAKLGVTSVNDLYPSLNTGFDLFKKFDDEGKLTARIHLYPALNDELERAKKFRDRYQSEKLKFTGLKQFIDGVVTGHTAYMLDPYVDRPDTKGETVFSLEQLTKWVLEADKEGFQIRFHAIGDGAVHSGLNMFAEAQKQNGKRDSRHALEHIEIIHPDDIKRLKDLGVIASLQPSHLALMPRTSHTTRVDERKYPYLYPGGSLKKAGAKVAFGTDFPVASLNPMKEIYHAVTRMDHTGESTWNEQESFTVADALKAYTQGSAYSVFREHELGTLEEGKFADIIIMNQNIFQAPPDEILNTSVVATMVDGKFVYSNSENHHLLTVE
ncbi:amidohydrolase [Brevibacillus fluminis]|uniref:Amidohydrolase n=1 Tax=Brevibacillus fluminis TaxID=511487 RepID=A0A3M8DUQ0_9BACL|nr:amidohydrolase [Brevibacillus fluminis]RNB91634.1 amidohydrolase [Brevibacillus fluminis]